jgi:Ca-activated chloride channel family protein
MKQTSHPMRRAAFLIFPLLILPFLLVATPSGGATRPATPQTPNAAHTARDAGDVAGSVRLIVTVVDEKGRFVGGLTKEAFTVFEGKSEREIVYLAEPDVPVSVGLLLDVSGSMQWQGLQAAKLTAARFVERSRPDNAYFVSEFNNTWRELTDWTSDAGAVAAGLRRAGVTAQTATKQGRPPQPQGATALHDACFGALEKLTRAPHPKRVLFIITDGSEDNASTRKLRDLKQLIQTSGVLVYAIAMRFQNNTFYNERGERNLFEITQLSGGRVFFPGRNKELIEVIDLLALELRQQYVLGFAPANAAPPGKWNKVKIKVRPPDRLLKGLYARSREGYFSPAPANAP